MRIAVAISGGVDSSVCAKLLLEEGHEVVLCHFLMSDKGEAAVPDAKRVAEFFGLPFVLKDLRSAFEERVVAPFIREYLNARTPNPCVLCNPTFKFRELIAAADEAGCELAATGHYAVVRDGRLFEAKDLKKDQSYFLARLSHEQLKRIVFPLGGFSKPEVREIAKAAGIPVAEKHDSQEICFIPGDDYEAFLKTRAPEAFSPGEIVDTEGRAVGEHVGLPAYTIGQRKKIGAHCERKYVVKIDKENNRVTIGGNEDLARKEVLLEEVSFILPAAEKTFRAAAKIRSTSPPKPCLVSVLERGRASLVFDEPERAVTPGQTGVIYLSGEVLGAGTITD